MNLDALTEMLARHEGERLKMYKCPAGYNTIGVGHNLDAKSISQRASRVILEDDIADVFADLDKHLTWWRGETEARQLALADLCFNMGIGGLLKFKNTLAAWKSGDYVNAALGLRTSKWFEQVGRRSHTITEMVRNG
jgi:lysozyme